VISTRQLMGRRIQLILEVICAPEMQRSMRRSVCLIAEILGISLCFLRGNPISLFILRTSW